MIVSQTALSASAQRFQDALVALGRPHRVVEMPATTRSSVEAAAAIGCTVAQIAKSIVFKGVRSGKPILAIASGVNRIDERKLAAHLGETPGRADADFVRAATGYAIGGVPPLGHATPAVTLIDRDLLAFERIWAAAGTPNAVFALAPSELVDMTGGATVDLKKDTPTGV